MPILLDNNTGTAHTAGPWPGRDVAVSQTRCRHEVLAAQRPVRLDAGALRAGVACDQVTVPAPLALQQPAVAGVGVAATWVEAWLPQAAYAQVQPGQAARIMLSGAGFAPYEAIDGTVTAVQAGNSPGVIGSTRFCRVRIRPSSGYFVGGRTYHPLLPGVSIQVALRTAEAVLTALLAAVRSRPA